MNRSVVDTFQWNATICCLPFSLMQNKDQNYRPEDAALTHGEDFIGQSSDMSTQDKHSSVPADSCFRSSRANRRKSPTNNVNNRRKESGLKIDTGSPRGAGVRVGGRARFLQSQCGGSLQGALRLNTW